MHWLSVKDIFDSN